ncbi:hypothetical protein EV426DRAFT_109389 [Tirmania nivea]|nr:hypothetical protein EV426DRAFT_109389 [Tirmania nivea]
MYIHNLLKSSFLLNPTTPLCVLCSPTSGSQLPRALPAYFTAPWIRPASIRSLAAPYQHMAGEDVERLCVSNLFCLNSTGNSNCCPFQQCRARTVQNTWILLSSTQPTLEPSSIYEVLLQSYLSPHGMKTANFSQPPGSALDSRRSNLQMQPVARMHTNLNQDLQGPRDENDDMENVIIVRTPPQAPKQSSPSLTSSQLLAQRTSSSTELPIMTRPSPPRRESIRSAGHFTPLMYPQTIQTTSSAEPFSSLPPIALPLRPATPNTFRASFGNRETGFGPGPIGSADDAPTMSSSSGKRKRMSGVPTMLLPGMLPFQRARAEEISDTIVVSQPSSISDKTDEDESENAGKRKKMKGIMKKTKIVAPIALPSPGVERAELLFDMDRLSIENEAESSGEHLLEQQEKLGEEAGIATGSNNTLEGTNMQDDEGKMDGLSGGNTTIFEEEVENEQDHSMEGNELGTVKPFPSRRRLRSPPPPPVDMGEDGEDEDEAALHSDPQKGGDDDGHVLSPPLPPTSIIPGDEDEDDEEDLATGAKGAFYYKPTPAERWARSQKRLQQIREYKARESREEREKRRRRRGSLPGGRTGGGGIGGIGKMAAVARKVRFSA